MVIWVRISLLERCKTRLEVTDSKMVTVTRYVNIAIIVLHADSYSPVPCFLTEVPVAIPLEKIGDYKRRLREDQIKGKTEIYKIS